MSRSGKSSLKQDNIAQGDRINDGRKQLRASIIFAHLQPGQTQVLSGKKLVWGRLVYVSALRLDDVVNTS
ncbi:hypothetical protein [Pleurocapsa sp. FMAR1]|uniref:hypothetical protein n=1 Tax=Pleurocapsa sp. FMAR1 TaxID=3040204 RepID=UPI0029C63956|nr:hypothetical protein [Pleurocapsa sp. FMAR1]